MAGDARDSHRRLDGGLSKEIQTQLGILAFPFEQRAMDYLGSPRSRVRLNLVATVPCLSKHSRRAEESQSPSVTYAM